MTQRLLRRLGTRHGRSVRLVCGVAAVGCWSLRLWGMDPDVRRVVSPDTLLVIEINRPVRVIDRAFIRELWGIARESAGARAALAAPEVEKLRQAGRFVEKSLDTDWKTGLSRLTAGGVVVAVHPGPSDQDADITAVVTSDDEAVLKRFVESVQGVLRGRGAEAGPRPAGPDSARPGDPAARQYRNTTCYQVGRGHFAVVGRRLLASNRRSRLEAALDRLLGTDAAALPLAELPPLTAPDGGEPLLLATLNLKFFRDHADARSRASLEFPCRDAVAGMLLAGYLDLLARADLVQAALAIDDAGGELRLRLPVGAAGAYPGLAGYFAGRAGGSALPLLTPRGTLYSASWYRDYLRLWEQRGEWLQAEAVRQLEEESARQKQDGLRLGLDELLRMTGPHVRVVAARARARVYQTPLEDRLPAGAVVLALRDERQFRERVVEPVDRLLALGIATWGGEFRSSEHRGAMVSIIRFPEAGGPLEPDQRLIYNFDPAYCVTGGHLVVGSTSEIVRDVLDELARPPATAAAGDAAPASSLQSLSLPEISRLLAEDLPRAARDLGRDSKLSHVEMQKEFEIVRRLLERLGTVTGETRLGERDFDVRIRLGPPSAAGAGIRPLASPRQ